MEPAKKEPARAGGVFDEEAKCVALSSEMVAALSAVLVEMSPPVAPTRPLSSAADSRAGWKLAGRLEGIESTLGTVAGEG